MFNMKYHAVIEKIPDEGVIVTLTSGIDRSRLRENVMSRVHFSDDKSLKELVFDFYAKMPPLKADDEDTKTKLRYGSNRGVDVFPFFVKYFSSIGHKTGSLWIEC